MPAATPVNHVVANPTTYPSGKLEVFLGFPLRGRHPATLPRRQRQVGSGFRLTVLPNESRMRSMNRKLLERYLRNRGESQRAFERRIGSKPGLVSRYLNEDRTPNGRLAFIIEQATDGAVPAAGWFPKRRPKSGSPSAAG